ncbi:hypothetical protein [Streptomyces noursei]|uniref:hypothetical protein n=1 Tax=Streptomyces noursei TaxID=1971 RepID=UPI001676E853|nr:hypothetical protein [Streptomyces noursei]MCZ1013982.1 hypothetical protein [Streptomyces noursei]GGX40417.1 hypothetical protein GCM10010341_72900 [Streptomyces noursei]
MTALVPSSFAAPSGREGVVASVDATRQGALVALQGVITDAVLSSQFLVTLSDQSGSVMVRVPDDVRHPHSREAFARGRVLSLVGRRDEAYVLAVRVALDGAVAW